jgi:hypothetical protein
MAPASEWDDSEQRLELRLRRFGIPVALAMAWVLVKSDLGHFVLRTFCSMWVHELGHAVAAWLCGYPAFPGPWVTLTAESRSPLLVVVLFAALAWAAFRAWRGERLGLILAFGAVALVQLVCTLALPAPRAQQLILFAGDGGALVIGTLLMLTLYVPEGSVLKRDWLRWGFLAIGAASFADVFEQWLSARHDPDRIPFGMNEGVGPSDPSRLSDHFGWSADQLVSRYVALGCLCLLVLASGYFFGLRRSDNTGAHQG